MMMMTGMRWKIVELVAMWMQPLAFEGEGRRLVTEMLCCAATTDGESNQMFML